MGWGNCGEDSEGRPIGYVFEATCDEEGCEVEIDRGLGYSCGGMHGTGTHMCEKYFCEAHTSYTWLPAEVLADVQRDVDEREINHGLCARCCKAAQQVNRVYESEERFEIRGRGTVFVIGVGDREEAPESGDVIWMNGRRVTCIGVECQGVEWWKRPIGLLVRAYDDADVDEEY